MNSTNPQTMKIEYLNFQTPSQIELKNAHKLYDSMESYSLCEDNDKEYINRCIEIAKYTVFRMEFSNKIKEKYLNILFYSYELNELRQSENVDKKRIDFLENTIKNLDEEIYLFNESLLNVMNYVAWLSVYRDN